VGQFYVSETNTKRIIKFIDKFPKTCSLIINKLGGKPFHLRGPINASALDSVFCTIIDHYDKISNDLKERYNKLKNDDDFYNYTTIGTTDANTLKNRFKLVKQFLVD